MSDDWFSFVPTTPFNLQVHDSCGPPEHFSSCRCCTGQMGRTPKHSPPPVDEDSIAEWWCQTGVDA